MDYVAIERGPDDGRTSLSINQIITICQRGLGPDVAIRSVRELAGGTFNLTFLVELTDETKTILRVAPPSSADQDWEDVWLMRREVAIQPFFSSIQHLMPKILAVDFTHQVIDWDYMLQSYIEGERWDRLEETLTPAENHQLWQQFGSIVKQIHATTGAHFGWPSPGQQFATWRETVLYRFERTLQAMVANRLDVTHFRRAYELARANARGLAEIQTPHLLHGDLGPSTFWCNRAPLAPQLSASSMLTAPGGAIRWPIGPCFCWPSGAMSQSRNRCSLRFGALTANQNATVAPVCAKKSTRQCTLAMSRSGMPATKSWMSWPAPRMSCKPSPRN